MRRTGRRSSRSRSRRTEQLNQAQYDISSSSTRTRGPGPETGAVRRSSRNNESKSSNKTHRTSFADEVQVQFIPRAWETPELYYTVPENTCPPCNESETDQENLGQQQTRRKLFPGDQRSPFHTHTPQSSYEPNVDSPQSPPFRVVAVPVEVDEENAKVLPPLGIVYEYDPTPSWVVPQYEVPTPDDEARSSSRQYESKPGLATPWERNEERSRRRERRHKAQRTSPVSPDEFVPPLENWFKTPGHVIADLLKKKRESREDPINERYEENAENGDQILMERQTYDDVGPSDNDYMEPSNTDAYDCDENGAPEYDDEMQKEYYEANKRRFKARIREHSKALNAYFGSPITEDNAVNNNPFYIYQDSPEKGAETVVPETKQVNNGKSNTFTIYQDSPEKAFTIYQDSPEKGAGKSNTFTVYQDSPEKVAETVVPEARQVNSGQSNTFTIYRDSPEKEGGTAALEADGVDSGRVLATAEPGASFPIEEKIDYIMKYLDLQDYIERKSVYRHLKKVQEMRRERIFNTLTSIDSPQEISPARCVDAQELVEEISGSSNDDTDGSYYNPGYGTPYANENIKKKL